MNNSVELIHCSASNFFSFQQTTNLYFNIKFQAGDALIQLYHNFITDFETKINLLKLAHFAVIVSRQYSEKEAAINYLDGVIEKLRATGEQRIEEPILYIKMQIATFKLEQGDKKECKKLLEDGKSTLDSMTDIDPSVYASYYWVSSQYHKFHQEFAEFYKCALLYLAYTSVESLSESFKLDLAFDLSLSALLGDNIYNFGELLAHPIVRILFNGLEALRVTILASNNCYPFSHIHSLPQLSSGMLSNVQYVIPALDDVYLYSICFDRDGNFPGQLWVLGYAQIKSLLGTKVEWLYYILEAFNSGDLVRYQELSRVHNAALRAQPALVENEKKLLEKINILCLMEIIFSRPSEDRTIPLNIIADRTKLSIEDVEHLLMKSLSVHLIEGIIDQVEGTVHVSWVQPRVLGIPQIKSLRDRLDNWLDKVHTALLSIEAETPDLVAS
ncbi:hypothetical protein JRO89_XS01G0077500 [Xanthoceras sorbifolium]|uniref:PCI domain-containing protein n=1 Tax=Xanthoceras sorbifolium TaxID=99658 RepID=A0ABQ8IJ08_9ROSI|nr:hypothetical protein JRO89_XS01G0077500 [Xanthoceras sorbifolium]